MLTDIRPTHSDYPSSTANTCKRLFFCFVFQGGGGNRLNVISIHLLTGWDVSGAIDFLTDRVEWFTTNDIAIHCIASIATTGDRSTQRFSIPETILNTSFTVV